MFVVGLVGLVLALMYTFCGSRTRAAGTARDRDRAAIRRPPPAAAGVLRGCAALAERARQVGGVHADDQQRDQAQVDAATSARSSGRTR